MARSKRIDSERAGAIENDALIDNRYRIVGKLGAGGMGTVLIAEHVELRRKVALKILQESIGEDVTMRKRFEREARTLASMSHPNIVSLNDYGIWEGTPYLVMELLEGRTLRDLLDEEGSLPQERALAIGQQVLRALSYAHSNNVVHRDLKPANVFLQALPDHVDHVKLLDFGFAKFVDSAVTSMVTSDGMVVGTPSYMAPEQATASPVDARIDVYSTGTLIFEMLAGRRPFEGQGLEVIRARLTQDAPTIGAVRPDLIVAPELEDALARALARKVEERWQSAAELTAALGRVPPNAIAVRSESEVANAVSPASLRSIEIVIEPSTALPASRTTELGSGDLDEVTQRVRSSRLTARLAWLMLAGLVAIGGAVLIWRSVTSSHAVRPVPVVVRPVVTPPPVEPPPPLEPPPVEPVVAPSPLPPPASGRGSSEGLPSDPWAGEVPPELLELKRRIDRPLLPTLADLQTVGGYARRHAADPRPLLVLAHGYVRTRWLTGALERYAQAYAMDRGSRGDPTMLTDLVSLVGSPLLGPQAQKMVGVIYGREALPAIDAALPSQDALTTSRLTELRAEIVAAP